MATRKKAALNDYIIARQCGDVDNGETDS